MIIPVFTKKQISEVHCLLHAKSYFLWKQVQECNFSQYPLLLLLWDFCIHLIHCLCDFVNGVHNIALSFLSADWRAFLVAPHKGAAPSPSSFQLPLLILSLVYLHYLVYLHLVHYWDADTRIARSTQAMGTQNSCKPAVMFQYPSCWCLRFSWVFDYHWTLSRQLSVTPHIPFSSICEEPFLYISFLISLWMFVSIAVNNDLSFSSLVPFTGTSAFLIV